VAKTFRAKFFGWPEIPKERGKTGLNNKKVSSGERGGGEGGRRVEKPYSCPQGNHAKGGRSEEKWGGVGITGKHFAGTRMEGVWENLVKG